MRFPVAFLAIPLLFMAGCDTLGSKSLDRARALDLLRRDPRTQVVATAMIHVGKPCIEFETADYRALRALGFIQYRAAQDGEIKEVRVTPQGEAAFRAAGATSSKDVGCASRLLFVPLAKADILEVTGIVRDGSVARVDYRWKSVPSAPDLERALYLSEAWKAVGLTASQSQVDNWAQHAQASDSADQTSHARFVLYDDGWRLAPPE